MTVSNNGIIRTLIDKGVTIPNPESIEIGKEVNPERISAKGVVIHNGSKNNQNIITFQAIMTD